MSRQERLNARPTLTTEQKFLSDLWEEHMRYEFVTQNTEDTLATMVEDAYVNHIPVLTGGIGRDELREFYSKRFIPQMPPDTEMVPISRTIGTDQVVDEMDSPIRYEWTGCCPALLLQGSALRSRWLRLSDSGMVSWPTSTFTGTRPPCSSSLVCSMPAPCRWQA
jgi:hypothetical protein